MDLSPALAAGFNMMDSSPNLSAKAKAQRALRSSVSRESSAWAKYSSELQEQEADDPDSGSNFFASPPPNPGARPLLRFRQSFMLAPTASTAATSSATPGLGPAPGSDGITAGSLDADVSNRCVEVRVSVPELRHETGLSEAAMKHILAVCGRDR